MKKSLLIFLLISLLTVEGFSQRRPNNGKHFYQGRQKQIQKGSSGGPFADTQLWLGLKGGINYGKAVPTERYAVFTSTVSQDLNKDYEKSYDAFGQNGYQFGMIFNFNFLKYLSLSFQPEYQSFKFGYTNKYIWSGTNNNAVQLNQHHRFTLNYVELPLVVRFDFMRKRFRPYLQAGGFYRTLTKADKNVDYTSLDKASGAQNPIENTYPTVGANDLFIKSNLGLLGGIGVNYDLGNVRLGLDAFYKIGMTNITNEKNRFSDDRLTSIGDTPDGMKVQNISVSFSVIFPMKYLEISSFKRVNP
jgi:hypothetical protein